MATFVRSTFSALVQWFRSTPLPWILCAAFVLHIVGIGWGLPGSSAWEDDGIAPRDFVVDSYLTSRPGHYFTYPPVHLVGLSLLTSPIWGPTLASAPSLSQADVVATMIEVPTMTRLSVVARLVSEIMALGIIYFLAKLAEEVWGKGASILVALVIAVNAPLTYYAHTSNLDVPYLFWACFGLLETVRAIARREPRRLRRAVLFGALAVGTKDQAYAIFLLGFPVAMAMWFLLDRDARDRRREIVRHLVIGLVVAGILFLLVSGAITNPSGFRARIHFLLGPASQNHAYYAATWAGRFEVMRGLVHIFDKFYPWPFAAALLAGLGYHLARSRLPAHKLVAGLVPLLGALSFVVCFNMTARRTEHRFAMPAMLLLGVYAGVAFHRLIVLCGDHLLRRRAALASVGALLCWGLYECVVVDANLILDPRYGAEEWLSTNAGPNDLVEVYGVNAYLPRFPQPGRITRVDVSPLSTRNPLPHVVEVQATFSDIESRKPRFIVVPNAWAWRWFVDEPPPGRVVPPEQAERQRDEATRAYFRALATGKIGYRCVHVATWSSKVWPRYDIHSSVAKDIHIFERED